MSERRKSPVTGEWTTFATHRQGRTFLPAADDCPLCPTRDGGAETEIPRPAFDIAVFDNRFPGLSADPGPPSMSSTPLYAVEPGLGACEVVVYTDDHTATLAEVGVDRIRLLVDVWADRYTALGARPEVSYVYAFENKGEAIGVTLHHPHGQIYAFPEIPPRALLHLTQAQRHLVAFGSCVWCDVVDAEVEEQARLVLAGRAFAAYVPFAARFPYEVHLVARRHAVSLAGLTDPERADLADVLDRVLKGYDALFGFSLPYVLSVFQAPTDGDDAWQPVSHLHIQIAPPHRTATKLKYLAGTELGVGAFLNDTLPEVTAGELRAAVARAGR